MSRQIVWSPLAERDFANILEYLIENWDKKVTNQFIDLTQEVVEQISNNPQQYPIIYRKEKSESAS
jgi:plasmid stabilization system protein ParE